jgi:hypothetical protein
MHGEVLNDQLALLIKTFPRRFELGLVGGWAGCPPRLMLGINEAVAFY